MSRLPPGALVAGRFRIESIIGEGGMGTVYLASHVTLPRKYAIKVLKGNFATDAAYVERFRREAIAASRVVHPNVVYITDFGQLDDGAFYIVMEYLQGFGLDELLESSGAQPLSRALPLLIQLADALDYAGALGVVHRDLKPENIMLCEIRGRRDVVKLVDFGIAKIVAAGFATQRITVRGQIFGTPEYISPEQAMDAEVDTRSDVYSLGIIAYELTTGAAPFEGSAPSILQAHVQKEPPAPSGRMRHQFIPPSFDGIVLKCLAKNPDHRYQTAGAVCRDLMKLRGQLAGMAEDLVAPRARRTTRSHQRVATDGEWSPMSSKREPMLAVLTEHAGQTGEDADARAAAGRAMELAVSSQDLREELHDTLKELAFSLSESSIRSDELSTALSQLLQIEEEVRSLSGKIAMLEQNFDRIRFEYGEQETMLRYAVIDLRLMRSQLLEHSRMHPGAPPPEQGQDLQFQIDALQTRLDDVTQEKVDRIQTLNDDVKRYKQARAEREETVAQRYTELHFVVEGVRPQAHSGRLPELYARLDELSEKLQLARNSVRILRRPRP